MAPKRQTIRHATIIGVGLLGGSAGLALKRRFASVRVAGVGRRQVSLDAALRVGAIDTAHFDAAEAVARSDLVLLATPVGAFGKHLKAIAPHLKRGVLVTDVGSTKAAVVRTAERILGKGGPFVGSHPMAGSERKGPKHARRTLFDDALCILTPTRHTPEPLARRAERLWEDLGMRTVRMTPAAHDRALARVSHLPHLLSAMLMLLPDDADLGVAATGFASMTRLAGGDPEMWRDILLTNRKAIVAALDTLGGSLARLRDQIADRDTDEIENLLAEAKKRRDHTRPE